MALLCGAVAPAADYYVTTQGGFEQLNSRDFDPGDRIFLAGGTTFAGTLVLGSSDTGTDASGKLIAPILITSYGSGRATIAAGNEAAITAYNNGGIEIRHLNLVGSGVAADGTTASTKSGISFYNDSPGDRKFEHLRIADVEVRGFGSRGIVIGGYNGDAGYHDVRLTRVVAEANLHAGIETYGYLGSTAALTGVTVEHCIARHHPGKPGSAGNTGSGIVLGGVTGGLVERCLAHDNGANNTASEGPVGIWAYHSSRIVLQHNEAYRQRTRGGDGGGFDLDIGVTDSVMQYNYSHDNDGAGFLLYGMAGSDGNRGNTVRYNVSENDGRNPASGAASGINLSNNVRDAAVYGNTVVLPAPPGGTSVSAVRVVAFTHQPDDIVVANNLFVTAGGNRLATLDSTGEVLFAGNNYWPGGGAFVIRQGGQNYGSLSSWRSAKGQERLGGQPTGSSADPRFEQPQAAGKALIGGAVDGLAAFKLHAESPLIDGGLDLRAAFGIDPGPVDFFGARVAQGDGHEIGAHEFAVEPPMVTGFHFAPAAGTATLRYRSELGTAFAVLRSPDLKTWTPLPPTAAGDGGEMEYADTPPPGARHFYVLARE